MKVISIRQPWASLIVRGVKDIENRVWRSLYRGPLLIHASKNYDFRGQEWIERNFPGALRVGEVYRMGGIVGAVEMVDCVQSHPSRWFFGPWGFVYINARELEFISLRGRLGIWDFKERKLDK